MQPAAEQEADENPDDRQDNRLAVDVQRRFAFIIPQHFERRQFAAPFFDVDVGQIVNHHRRQDGRQAD